MMKLCFLQATNPVDVKWHAQGSFGYLKASLDAALPGQIEFSVARTIQEAVAFSPHILGVSALSQDFDDARALCDAAKAAGVPCVVMGGFHITAFPETLPETADLGVIGEGEITFREVAASYLTQGKLDRSDLSRIPGIAYRDETGRVVTTGPRAVVPNLDDIPLPDRRFGMDAGQTPYLFTSRGCAFRCSFCASSRYWPNVRFHSAGRIMQELESILAGFPGMNGVSIWDDLFAADRRRLREFTELFEAAGLNRRLSLGSSVRANLIDDELCGLLRRLRYGIVGFGAESGSDPILKKLKDEQCSVAINQRALDVLHRNGLKGACGFVLGHYDETEEDVLRSYEFIMNNYAAGKMAKHEITILTPMPGTETWQWAREQGVIPERGFAWKSLRYLAMFSNNLSGIDDWIGLRERNGSMYLNERNVPLTTLYDIIRHYEDKIRRQDFTAARPHSAKSPEQGLPQYYLHRREEIIAAVPAAALRILDVGCGGGTLGRALKEQDPRRTVTGIEQHEQAAAHARAFLDAVHHADADVFDPPFSPGDFDCIVFADVLEHLRDPWAVLRRYTPFLKPGGTIVASIPNVRRLTILRDLADSGAWEYQDEGVLDRTHLRFFTKKQFQKLLDELGIAVQSVRNLPGEDLRRFAPAGPDRIVRAGRFALVNVSDEEFEELMALQFLFTGIYRPGAVLPKTGRDEAYRGAAALAAAGKHDEAAAALEALIAADPGHAFAQNDLGVLALIKGDKEGALARYEAAVKLSPENITFRKNLADLLAVGFGRTMEALPMYLDIAAKHPDDVETLLALGHLSLTLGRAETAAQFYRRVLDLTPDNEQAREGLRRAAAPATDAPKLSAVRIDSAEAYQRHAEADTGARAERSEREAALVRADRVFTVPGYCYVCGKDVDFLVDYETPVLRHGRALPNWRERVICPECRLNNRMRAAIQFFEETFRPRRDARIYLTEQTTPLYRWFRGRYPNAVGSEYLNGKVPRGGVDERGIRNEDVTSLSFGSGAFDFVLSFDVFEHVPGYRRAFAECVRVLKPGGAMVLSVPFTPAAAQNTVYAVQEPDGSVRHLRPPVYHGDPANPAAGCLCYQVFGWEMLGELTNAGFGEAHAHLYWSDRLGYLGGEQVILSASTAAPRQPAVNWEEGYRRYCTGKGIEIGSGGRPLPGLNTLQVDIVNDYNGFAYHLDHIAPADELSFAADSSLDFIVHSNMLEHLANPVKALLEWHRAIRPGGILYMIVPDKRLWITDRQRNVVFPGDWTHAFREGRPNRPEPPNSPDTHFFGYTLDALRHCLAASEALAGRFELIDSYESSPDTVAAIVKDVNEYKPNGDHMGANYTRIMEIQRSRGEFAVGHNFHVVLRVCK